MLPGLLRFEWRYHTRRATFLVAALALMGCGLALVGTGYGPANVHVNSPYVVAQSLGVLSLLGVFVLTIFCAPAALRDTEHGMTGIVFATPVGKPRYLLGRLAGALLAGTAVLTLAALALLLAPWLLPVAPERLGAVQPLAYLWALLVLVVPNLLLVGVLLFGVATLTRSTLATYVGAVAIYALYLVTALLVDSPLMAGTAPPTPEALARAALLDPFGLSAFFEQTRYWTPAERDTRLLLLSGHLLLNRLLWLSVAAGVLALVYGRFRLEELPRRSARKQPKPAALEAVPSSGYQPVAPGRRNRAALMQELRAALRLELHHVLRGWPLRVLLVVWGFVVGMECAGQTGGGEYGTHLLPSTGLMLDAIRLPLLLLGTVVLVYYAAEIVWRERTLGVAAWLDATPAPNAVFYLAKAAALLTLPLLLTLVSITVGMGVQLTKGYAHLEPGLYLTLLWFAGLPLMLFGLGALLLQLLSPNRWLGMMGSLLLAFVAYRGAALGLEHPMLHFGTGPGGGYSTMDGFGPILPSFAAFMLYWTLLAALLAALSGALWRRGPEATLTARLRSLPRQWQRRGRWLLAAGIGLLLVVAAGLYWQTSVRHPWQTQAERQTWRADYERTYRPLAGRPQPGVVAVRTQVDLFPASRRAAIRGSYTLENRTAQPIDTLLLMLPEGAEGVRVSLPGGRLLRHDARFGAYLLRLPQPLQPRQQTLVHFSLTLDRGGIRAADFRYDVAENGTMLMEADAFPMLGYRPGLELDEPEQRRRQGLPIEPSKRPSLPGPAGLAAVHAAGPARPWLTLDAVVSTEAGQTALAPGQLVRSWTRSGRRYFHYRQPRPMTPNFGFVSARYAVQRVQQGPTTVEVWYHPAHQANVPRILAAAARSLRVLGPRYGAYPHSTLRIAEVPVWASFGAFALPGLVLFTEDRGFTADARPGDVDLLLRRVAHEVAHQWWGHRLDPAAVAGASTLVETLAKHSEQLVLADAHGPQALPPMLAFDEDRYLAGRTQEETTEPSMLEVENQDYLYYGKGAVLMNSLRARLGPAAVDRALARLLAAYGGPHGAATTRDLWTALLTEARTPVDRALVDEWLTQRVTHELRVDTALVTPVGGRFRATVRLSTRKTDSRNGQEKPLSTEGEPVEVAVLDGPPGAGKTLYTAQPRVQNGRIELQISLPRRPAYVVVDPKVHYLDRERSNNQRRFLDGQ